MKFEDLAKDHEEYKRKGNQPKFKEYEKREVWNFHDLSEENVKDSILGFINQWGICRIPYERKAELLVALRTIEEDIRYFKGKRLWEDFDPEEQRSRISRIFNELGKINRVSSVAISKMLHMFSPDFFVMWDNAIMKNYGFCGNAEGYINFLRRIREIIVENDLVEAYRASEIKGEASLLKLIDEYNFERMRS